MNHPSREVNGSGRILFREIRMERNPGTYSTVGTVGGAWNPSLVRLESPVMARKIIEWSPSGDYLNLDGFWYHRKEIELLEVLP